MYLSIATTHQPATDLGFLLNKHPDRLHELALTYGRALIVYPEASEARCEAALLLDAHAGTSRSSIAHGEPYPSGLGAASRSRNGFGAIASALKRTPR